MVLVALDEAVQLAVLAILWERVNLVRRKAYTVNNRMVVFVVPASISLPSAIALPLHTGQGCLCDYCVHLPSEIRTQHSRPCRSTLPRSSPTRTECSQYALQPSRPC